MSDPTTSPVKILVVEDEPEIARSLEILLTQEGFEPVMVDRGEAALARYATAHLMLLDLMLPGISGFEVLKQVRAADALFPVIIVSARSAEEDVVEGLTLGADDYVTKPFSIRELMLRVRRTLALHRRVPRENVDEIVPIGERFRVNFTENTAITALGERALTAQEAAVLRYLTARPGQVCSRADLLQNVWGLQGHIESRTVDNFMVRFRKYFELNPQRPKHFLTLRARGYMFTPGAD
ncbi:response regulator transcription factor [Myxococcota bacterium]|nr:response regulator transcription factor [Myxococcota bacterium]